MDDMEDKLSSFLSNPEAMEKDMARLGTSKKSEFCDKRLFA